MQEFLNCTGIGYPHTRSVKATNKWSNAFLIFRFSYPYTSTECMFACSQKHTYASKRISQSRSPFFQHYSSLSHEPGDQKRIMICLLFFRHTHHSRTHLGTVIFRERFLFNTSFARTIKTALRKQGFIESPTSSEIDDGRLNVSQRFGLPSQL